MLIAIRRFLSNPLQSIAILILFSMTVLAIHSLEHAALCLLSAIVFAILVGVKLKELMASLAYVAPVLVFYTVAASVFQVVLLNYVDMNILLLNIVRIEALVAMSIAIVRSIDIVKLISLSRRISVRLALAIALSLKMMRDFSSIWRVVRDTYSINLGVRGLKKIFVHMLAVETFLTLSLYSVIQTAEAIITRPRLYTHQENFWDS